LLERSSPAVASGIAVACGIGMLGKWLYPAIKNELELDELQIKDNQELETR
jgi:hypothetical protein